MCEELNMAQRVFRRREGEGGEEGDMETKMEMEKDKEKEKEKEEEKEEEIWRGRWRWRDLEEERGGSERGVEQFTDRDHGNNNLERFQGDYDRNSRSRRRRRDNYTQ